MTPATVQDRSYYAGHLEGRVGELLDQATAAWSETQKAESYLLEAQRLAPSALPVFFSLYKFYFYKGELEQAEMTVREALRTAALLGDFEADWTKHELGTAPWSSHDNPAHFYLFSLKALAFIRLRRGDTETCRTLLAKLQLLDPSDTIGSGVIASLMGSLGH